MQLNANIEHRKGVPKNLIAENGSYRAIEKFPGFLT